MTQTLFGLTFDQAVRIAERDGACEGAVLRVQDLGSWEAVLKSEYLTSWLEWFSFAEVPIDALCACYRCRAKRDALTPEKLARAEELRALFLAASEAEDGFDPERDVIEALLRERLQETPDA